MKTILRKIFFLQRPYVSRFISLLVLLFFIYIYYYQEQWSFKYDSIQSKLAKFKNVIPKLPLLINTSHCKIPDFDPWNEEVRSILSPTKKPICKDRAKEWSHVDYKKRVLIMDADQIAKDGYKDLYCCYIIVKRSGGDKDVSYSHCHNFITMRVKIPAEFIIVECHRKVSNLEFRKVYRMFHTFLPLPDDPKLEAEAMKNRPDMLRQPNIIIIGQDATSRLNFRRHMNKTRRILESIGAVEMKGFTKAGDNTLPNLIPLLTGYDADEDLDRICKTDERSYFDECPFIWKELEEAGYITGHLEDHPTGGMCNYLQKGFKKQPVDFYSRPIFIAAHRHEYPLGKRKTQNTYFQPCIGYQTNTEFLLEYLGATLDFAKEHRAPLFNLMWSTTVSHDDLSGIANEDETYANFLQRLIDQGHLNNTILIIMGDHGYRYGKIRRTLTGGYEEKLPNLWIALPPWIKKEKAEWQEGLLDNSQQLTSPFMLYWTFVRIIQAFTGGKGPKDAEDQWTGEILRRKFRYNFFEPVPAISSCGDLGIPEEYCACYLPNFVDKHDANLAKAAFLSVKEINRKLINPAKCLNLTLSEIVGGVFLNKGKVWRYIVNFAATPGDALFEGEMDYDINTAHFSQKISVKRINRIDKKHLKCISDAKQELFCHCK